MHDAVGVIQSSVEPGSLGASTPHTYQYDQQYRLTSDKIGSSPLQGSTSTWQLDAATEITRTTSFVALSGVNTTSTRTYDAANELKSLLETQGSTTTRNYSLTYNSRGDRTQLYNKVSGATTTYRYDQADRLTSSGIAANPTTYRYNGDGVRVSKSTGLSSNSYVWGAGGDLLQEGGSSTSYIYGPGGMLVEAVQGTTPYYYHADQLGSVRALTNSSGSVVNTYTYDAYGNTTASTGTVANPFKYSGQYTDSETGFLYLRARYYDPATQQFLSVDPLLASTEQAYAYVGGSPLNGTDPSGLFCDRAGDYRPGNGCIAGSVSPNNVPPPVPTRPVPIKDPNDDGSSGIGGICSAIGDFFRPRFSTSDIDKDPKAALAAAGAAITIIRGSNFKDHWTRHKQLLRQLHGEEWAKWNSGEGQDFIDDLQMRVETGQLQYEGLGMLRGAPGYGLVYRGEGLTLLLRQNGEFWTLLKSGVGMDLEIVMMPDGEE